MISWGAEVCNPVAFVLWRRKSSPAHHHHGSFAYALEARWCGRPSVEQLEAGSIPVEGATPGSSNG